MTTWKKVQLYANQTGITYNATGKKYNEVGYQYNGKLGTSWRSPTAN